MLSKLKFLLLAASPLVLAACASTSAPADAPLPPPPAPAFTSIQPALLGMAGSLSNVWGDYDNDGDLDLAVSLKSGEVRLYRNDVVPDPLGRAGGRRGGVPRLKMKMIFSKVRPCCEAARRAAVSMPKMRLNPLQNVLIGGRRRAVQW